ncbi:transposase [Paraburkholderia sediminicola]
MRQDLTDEQWSRVEVLFETFHTRSDTRGRPLRNTRSVFNGVLWILSTGEAWTTLPARYPDYRTCHRRFKAWYDAGVLRMALGELFGTEGDVICHQVALRMYPDSLTRSNLVQVTV